VGATPYLHPPCETLLMSNQLVTFLFEKLKSKISTILESYALNYFELMQYFSCLLPKEQKTIKAMINNSISREKFVFHILFFMNY
jgi:hypothetical protein